MQPLPSATVSAGIRQYKSVASGKLSNAQLITLGFCTYEIKNIMEADLAVTWAMMPISLVSAGLPLSSFSASSNRAQTSTGPRPDTPAVNKKKRSSFFLSREKTFN